MRIGDRVYVNGCVDEIRKDVVIIRNDGGYFGTVPSEIIQADKEESPWISCKEKLPEDLEAVNVTLVDHNPEELYYIVKDKPFTASAVFYCGKWYWYSNVCIDLLSEYGINDLDGMVDSIEVIAWQKLPEPYKEVEHD